MTKARSRKQAARRPAVLAKCPSGIRGLDEITSGGLPRGRPALICGDAGTGKTLLGVEFLARGAQDHGEPGVLVTFEESAGEIAGTGGRIRPGGIVHPAGVRRRGRRRQAHRPGHHGDLFQHTAGHGEAAARPQGSDHRRADAGARPARTDAPDRRRPVEHATSPARARAARESHGAAPG